MWISYFLVPISQLDFFLFIRQYASTRLYSTVQYSTVQYLYCTIYTYWGKKIYVLYGICLYDKKHRCAPSSSQPRLYVQYSISLINQPRSLLLPHVGWLVPSLIPGRYGIPGIVIRAVAETHLGTVHTVLCMGGLERERERERERNII